MTKNHQQSPTITNNHQTLPIWGFLVIFGDIWLDSEGRICKTLVLRPRFYHPAPPLEGWGVTYSLRSTSWDEAPAGEGLQLVTWPVGRPAPRGRGLSRTVGPPAHHLASWPASSSRPRLKPHGGASSSSPGQLAGQLLEAAA